MNERWTRGGYAKQYPWPQCCYCGRASDRDCSRVECLLCGSPQCMGEGSRNGRCAVCHVGFLPGWSRGYNLASARHCCRKGCEKESVATLRKRAVCRDHAAPLMESVAQAIANRDSGGGWERWRLVA